MSMLVTATLQRLFFRPVPPPSRRSTRKVSIRRRDARGTWPDFAETRPLVFRSEAFAEDLRLSHGVL